MCERLGNCRKVKSMRAKMYYKNFCEHFKNMNAHVYLNTLPGSKVYLISMSRFFNILFYFKKEPNCHLVGKPQFRASWDPWRKTQRTWAKASFRPGFSFQLYHFTSCSVGEVICIFLSSIFIFKSPVGLL